MPNIDFGYAMITEEHAPEELIRNAQLAERAGFQFALISDHFHPWISRQGNSPFVWSVLGALSQVTKRMHFATGVTCPIIRYHPAIVAQAAATVAVMMPGRFSLGLGAGENLNEHIVGQRWPDWDMRASMLQEAVKIIRLLWQGEMQTYYGKYYIIENAKIYNLPEKPLPILMAASGTNAAQLAGTLADGLITTSPTPDIIETFKTTDHGRKRPCYGSLTVCYGKDEAAAKKLAVEQWPIARVPGELHQELRTPKHFEEAAQLVTEEELAKSIIFGKDEERHIKKIEEIIKAGIDKIYVHQIGSDQESLIKLYEDRILPYFKNRKFR